MTHYSHNPERVRVSVFKPNGKWYACGSVDMSGTYDSDDLETAVFQACSKSHDMIEQHPNPEGWPVATAPRKWLYDGGMIVCLSPYHQYAHPVMLNSSWLLHTDPPGPHRPGRP